MKKISLILCFILIFLAGFSFYSFFINKNHKDLPGKIQRSKKGIIKFQSNCLKPPRISKENLEIKNKLVKELIIDCYHIADSIGIDYYRYKSKSSVAKTAYLIKLNGIAEKTKKEIMTTLKEDDYNISTSLQNNRRMNETKLYNDLFSMLFTMKDFYNIEKFLTQIIDKENLNYFGDHLLNFAGAGFYFKSKKMLLNLLNQKITNRHHGYSEQSEIYKIYGFLAKISSMSNNNLKTKKYVDAVIDYWEKDDKALIYLLFDFLLEFHEYADQKKVLQIIQSSFEKQFAEKKFCDLKISRIFELLTKMKLNKEFNDFFDMFFDYVNNEIKNTPNENLIQMLKNDRFFSKTIIKLCVSIGELKKAEYLASIQIPANSFKTYYEIANNLILKADTELAVKFYLKALNSNTIQDISDNSKRFLVKKLCECDDLKNARICVEKIKDPAIKTLAFCAMSEICFLKNRKNDSIIFLKNAENQLSLINNEFYRIVTIINLAELFKMFGNIKKSNELLREITKNRILKFTGNEYEQIEYCFDSFLKCHLDLKNYESALKFLLLYLEKINLDKSELKNKIHQFKELSLSEKYFQAYKIYSPPDKKNRNKSIRKMLWLYDYPKLKLKEMDKLMYDFYSNGENASDIAQTLYSINFKELFSWQIDYFCQNFLMIIYEYHNDCYFAGDESFNKNFLKYIKDINKEIDKLYE